MKNFKILFLVNLLCGLLLLTFTWSGYGAEESSYLLMDLDSGEVLEKKIISKTHLPASVAKILTGHYALSILGPDFRPVTKVLSSGEIKDGELQGDLILVGGGDPLLTAADLYNLVLEIKQKGIKKVSGKLLYDQNLFPATTIINPAGEKNSPDNSGISALNLEFNRYPLTAKGVPSALLPIVSENEIKKFPQLDTMSSAPVFEVSKWTAEYFKFLLLLEGINVSSVEEGKAMPNSKLLVSYKGKELAQMVKLMLEYSNNVVAESILMLSCQKKKNLGSCAFEMTDWYMKQMGQKLEIDLKNGSGMHFESHVNPEDFGSVLRYMFQNQNYSPVLKSLLPISGNSGWLVSRMKSRESFFRVFAKTGSLDFVSNIAGILKSSSKRDLVFVIFEQDSEKRKKMTKLLHTSGTSELQQLARDFSTKRRSYEDQLITSWILKY